METFKFEQPASQENKEEFESVVEKGIEGALQEIEERFENNSDEKENLPFHNKEHTEGVIGRTELILKTIREADPELVNEKDIQIGRLAAAYHDIIQEWEEDPEQKGKRKRFTAKNEEKSAEMAIEFMNEYTIFAEKEKETAKESIMGTVPGFDPEKGTVIQPNISKESSLIAQAIAFADLGTAGMNGPDSYLPEGDALFREENLDILEATKKPENITKEQKEEFRTRMLGWSNFQPKFAEGRQGLLDKELEGIPESAREAVKALFDKFENSIEAAKRTAEEREDMTFEKLLKDMKY